LDLKNFLSQPRAIKKDGTPGMDIFIFSPKDRSQFKMISIGDILELMDENDWKSASCWLEICNNESL